jgi:FdhE protein
LPEETTASDNPRVPTSPWQRRIQRAQELIDRHRFAAEILNFYVEIVRFQEQFHAELHHKSIPPAFFDADLGPGALPQLVSFFPRFLDVVQRRGPTPLADLAKQLHADTDAMSVLLLEAWRASAATDAAVYLAQAFLQPYAEMIRSRVQPSAASSSHATCPYCHRKPTLGVLRQMSEGAARSLVCSFCLAEWNFRRLVCPGCGEENDRMLSVFTATDFDYIRVECCSSCKTYIKTIDLTKNGRAEPIVDELASIPLDLWAQERGYAKLRQNILGM